MCVSTVLDQQLNGIKGGINVFDTKLASKTSIKQNTTRQCIIYCRSLSFPVPRLPHSGESIKSNPLNKIKLLNWILSVHFFYMQSSVYLSVMLINENVLIRKACRRISIRKRMLCVLLFTQIYKTEDIKSTSLYWFLLFSFHSSDK